MLPELIMLLETEIWCVVVNKNRLAPEEEKVNPALLKDRAGFNFYSISAISEPEIMR